MLQRTPAGANAPPPQEATSSPTSPVVLHAGNMPFRPGLVYFPEMNEKRIALVGFGGGLIGGLTAMPGVLPTICCDMYGVPKSRQRGLVQPFIAAMQVFALSLMSLRQDLSSRILLTLPSVCRRSLPDRRSASWPFATSRKQRSGAPSWGSCWRQACRLSFSPALKPPRPVTPRRCAENRSTPRWRRRRSKRGGCVRPENCR